MEKVVEKARIYESRIEERKIGKWIHMDLSILVVAAICTQLFANIWYGSETYISNTAGNDLCVHVPAVYTGNTGAKLEEWKLDAIHKAQMVIQAETVTEPAVYLAVTEEENQTGRAEIRVSDSGNRMVEAGIPAESQVVPDGEISAGVVNVPVETVHNVKTEYADNAVAPNEEENVMEERNAAAEPADTGMLLELEGFLVNEKGMIESCKDPAFVSSDGIIIFPSDERCTGIGQGALNGIAGVEEVYITENITSIETDVLEGLEGLMYIEVSPENPVYESRDGLLYSKEGELLVTPSGRAG